MMNREGNTTIHEQLFGTRSSKEITYEKEITYLHDVRGWGWNGIDYLTLHLPESYSKEQFLNAVFASLVYDGDADIDEVVTDVKAISDGLYGNDTIFDPKKYSQKYFNAVIGKMCNDPDYLDFDLGWWSFNCIEDAEGNYIYADMILKQDGEYVTVGRIYAINEETGEAYDIFSEEWRQQNVEHIKSLIK